MTEDAPEALRLALEDGEEPGQVRDVQVGGALRVLVTNGWTVGATAVLRARLSSRAGFDDREMARIHVGEGEVVPVALEARDLGLPAGAFDFSGNLTIDGRLEREDGEATNSVTLALHFHPTEEGWQVYDEAALEDLFDGGRLTAGARARQVEADELADQAAVAVRFVAGDSFGAEGGAR
jgi:hypothetical protein